MSILSQFLKIQVIANTEYYNMPGTVWNILRILMHLILTITLWDSTIFIPHFTDKETKVQQLSILSKSKS